MDIESYQLFCYAVEEKSISQAAKKAFISQPAATKKIQQLEEHYSTLLFERERGTLILTEAGQRLYEHAKLIIREYLDSIETIDMLHNRKRRTLRIGSSFTLGEYILPEIISAYSNPDIDIKLSISNTRI